MKLKKEGEGDKVAIDPSELHIPIESDKKDHKMVANLDECLFLKFVQDTSVPNLCGIIHSHTSTGQC